MRQLSELLNEHLDALVRREAIEFGRRETRSWFKFFSRVDEDGTGNIDFKEARRRPPTPRPSRVTALARDRLPSQRLPRQRSARGHLTYVTASRVAAPRVTAVAAARPSRPTASRLPGHALVPVRPRDRPARATAPTARRVRDRLALSRQHSHVTTRVSTRSQVRDLVRDRLALSRQQLPSKTLRLAWRTLDRDGSGRADAEEFAAFMRLGERR